MLTTGHAVRIPGPREAMRTARHSEFARLGAPMADAEIERILRATATREWQLEHLGWLDELREETADTLPGAPMPVFDNCPLCGLSRPDVVAVAHGYYARCRKPECGFTAGGARDPFPRLAGLYEIWHRRTR